MMMLVELVTVFAILNATLPTQDFPVEVDIRLAGSGEEEAVSGGEAAATAEPIQQQSLIDIASLTGLVTVAGGLFAAWKQSQKKDKEADNKIDAVADSTVNVKESVKASDYGNRDTAQILANALNKLSNVKTVEEIPQALSECAPAAKENAEAWKTDVKEYYENEPPVTNADLGLDKTRAKLVEVNKETKKTPET